MTKPLQVLFHGLERSDAVEEHIQDKFAKLEHLHPNIISGRVTIDLPHKHHNQGKQFAVRIDLTIPGKEIIVNRESGHEDMYMALRDAFDAARRQLDSYEREHRGDGGKRADEGEA